MRGSCVPCSHIRRVVLYGHYMRACINVCAYVWDLCVCVSLILKPDESGLSGGQHASKEGGREAEGERRRAKTARIRGL